MLSKHELEYLGVTIPAHMITLRMECIKYGNMKPVKTDSLDGNQKYHVDKNVLESLLDCDFKISTLEISYNSQREQYIDGVLILDYIFLTLKMTTLTVYFSTLSWTFLVVANAFCVKNLIIIKKKLIIIEKSSP